MRRIAVLAALLGAAAVPASANAAIAPGDYTIATGKSAFSKVLDAQSADPFGSRIVHFGRNGGLNQRWNVIQTGSTAGGTPAYSLRPRHNLGLCMDVENESDAIGARLNTFPCHFGLNQQFFISPEAGAFRIVPRHSGLTLTIPSVASNSQLIQLLGPIPPNQTLPSKQQFRFERL